MKQTERDLPNVRLNCVLRLVTPLVLAVLLAASALAAVGGDVQTYATKISSLIDPAKLATLGPRGANPRVEKYVACLAEAKKAGVAPKKVAARAVALAGMKGRAAKLTAEAMVRNVEIAEKLGCLDETGIKAMREGRAAPVRRGPYAGEEISVDHIIPRAVAPELDKVIANLELLPLKLNEGKNDKVGSRQVDLARKLHRAGLLSLQGLQAVERKRK
jgi:hypothetical protein